jgi:hypothetical protein
MSAGIQPFFNARSMLTWMHALRHLNNAMGSREVHFCGSRWLSGWKSTSNWMGGSKYENLEFSSA